MIVMIAAFLKPGADERLMDYHDAFNEHLGAGADDVRIAGALLSKDGRRAGYAIMSVEDVTDASEWLHQSPFYQADLYERVELLEYAIEAGHVD